MYKLLTIRWVSFTGEVFRSLVYQMFNYDLYITDVLTVLTSSSLKLLTYIKWLAPRKAI